MFSEEDSPALDRLPFMFLFENVLGVGVYEEQLILRTLPQCSQAPDSSESSDCPKLHQSCHHFPAH